MALSFVSRIGASPLGRAGVAIFSILTLAGAVQFGLPVICGAGAAMCRGDESAATAALEDAQAALDAALGPDASLTLVAETPIESSVDEAPTPGPSSQESAVEVAVAATPVALTYNDLIASTFAILDMPLVAQPPAELTARSVRTVTINADGTPVGELSTAAPAPLVAEAVVSSEPPVSVSEAPSSAEAAISVAAVAPAASEEERASSMAYAPASGDVATVTGTGANVRSLPKRGGSEVLFALRGGEEVTIVQMSQGWAKIVDGQGRSGWIYGVYLNRG